MSTKPTPALDASQQLATLDKHVDASEKPALDADKPLNANDVHTIIVRAQLVHRADRQNNRLAIVIPMILLCVFVSILDQVSRCACRHGPCEGRWPGLLVFRQSSQPPFP